MIDSEYSTDDYKSSKISSVTYEVYQFSLCDFFGSKCFNTPKLYTTQNLSGKIEK